MSSSEHPEGRKMGAMVMEEPVGAAEWRELRHGSQPAFRAIFDAHNRAVYNFAFRHSASWATAEDATQACFATVWRRARDGSLPDLADSSPRAWLFGVVRNECRNLARGSERHLRLVGLLTREPHRDTDNVDDWAAHEDGMRRINEVLARIPDNQRQVIELVAWSGLGMAEAAAALKVPVGTVKSRLARARQALATTEVAHLLGQESTR